MGGPELAAIKFETARIHFLSDVFVVVTYSMSSLDERSAVERSTRGDGKKERRESVLLPIVLVAELPRPSHDRKETTADESVAILDT